VQDAGGCFDADHIPGAQTERAERASVKHAWNFLQSQTIAYAESVGDQSRAAASAGPIRIRELLREAQDILPAPALGASTAQDEWVSRRGQPDFAVTEAGAGQQLVQPVVQFDRGQIPGLVVEPARV
jgi:hypothetical protein